MLRRRYTTSCTILIIVLLIHLLFLIACSVYTITHNQSPFPQQEVSEPYLYIPMQPPAPQPITPTDVKPITEQPPLPEPLDTQEDTPPEDPIDFASLFKKVEPVEHPEEPTIEEKEKNIASSTHGDIALRTQDIESKKNSPKTDATPPEKVAMDDLPMPFVGVNTTELTDRDTLFHQFIKAVNTALYASMHLSHPPYSSGAQPVVIRMVITRTGRLAQAPTVLRSSGNTQRDTWYVHAIQHASAQFPPIPPAIHLPFAELTYKEGMRAGAPIH